VCDKCQHNREAAVEMLEQMSNADKSREFYRRQGECRERERIIKLVELQSFIWMGEKQLIQISKDELINLIKEETE
jgi:hypothetical protein